MQVSHFWKYVGSFIFGLQIALGTVSIHKLQKSAKFNISEYCAGQ